MINVIELNINSYRFILSCIGVWSGPDLRLGPRGDPRSGKILLEIEKKSYKYFMRLCNFLN